MSYFFFFVFGLAIGSFINVVSLRYQPGQKLFDFKILGGRSHCPHCQKQLSWYELIPVLSFIFQKGRCRSCHQKISFQYPLVEILSGLIFVFIPLSLAHNLHLTTYNFFQLLAIGCWLLIFTLFLLLSIIDFRHYIIPDSINLSLGILGVFLIFVKILNPMLNTLYQNFLGYYSSLFLFTENIWLNHLIGFIFAVIVFGLIIFVSKGKGMGFGDLKLAAALGLIFGWPDILMALTSSFLIGGLIGIILIILKKKKMKDGLPFGPFLVTAAALTFFFGFQIINGYFKFLP